jgi:hypothetical protein
MDSNQVKKFVSKEGSLTWTMTTNGYKAYTLNLVSFLREVAKVSWKLCIICCDRESFDFFRREGVPCVLYGEKMEGAQTSVSLFGSASFARLNLKKLQLLDWVEVNAKELGIQKSLYLDGDIVIKQDPWPVLDTIRQEKGGLLFQCDCNHAEDHVTCSCICSGCICHYHEEDKPLNLYKLDTEQWKAAEYQDQPYIAKRLQTLSLPFYTLPRPLFGNGGWQKGGAWKESDWVLLHYNYRVGNTKKSAMQAAGHWRISY